MNKETSNEAYAYCIDKGLISQREAEVLKAITEKGRMNQSMAHAEVALSTNNPHLQRHSIGPRFAMLERMGLIRQDGKDECPFTGRQTLFYVATGNKPTHRPKNSAAEHRQTVAALQDRIKELETENGKLRELLNMRSTAHKEREERLRKWPTAKQESLFSEG